MKTPLKTSLSGAITPLFAGVIGLISLGVILLGWEWHSAHPGKHATEHSSGGSAKHAAKPVPDEKAAPADASGTDASGTDASGTATPAASHKKKHHKHGK
jgi:hypothetical protein